MILKVYDYPSEIGIVNEKTVHWGMTTKLVGIIPCCDTVDNYNKNQRIKYSVKGNVLIIENEHKETIMNTVAKYCPFCGAEVEVLVTKIAYVEQSNDSRQSIMHAVRK